MKRFLYILGKVVGWVTIGLILVGIYFGSRWIWHHFISLNPQLAAALLTASATVIGGSIAIAIGRYFERKKEVEAHFRARKSEIYDAFLKAFFDYFYQAEAAPGHEADSTDLVAFLREWQRQMILWGGSRVLTTYLKWIANLKTGNPSAHSLFLMEDFFLKVRSDLGLSNKGFERGSFIRLMLKHGDVLLAMAKVNPNVTLQDVSAKEKELGLS